MRTNPSWHGTFPLYAGVPKANETDVAGPGCAAATVTESFAEAAMPPSAFTRSASRIAVPADIATSVPLASEGPPSGQVAE